MVLMPGSSVSSLLGGALALVVLVGAVQFQMSELTFSCFLWAQGFAVYKGWDTVEPARVDDPAALRRARVLMDGGSDALQWLAYNLLPGEEVPSVRVEEKRVADSVDALFFTPLRAEERGRANAATAADAKDGDHHGGKPLIIWMHAGGFVVGSPQMDIELCQRLAQATNSYILSLNYAKAPEAPFPRGLEDVVRSIRWVYAQQHQQQQPPQQSTLPRGVDYNRIVVGGQSAGGNLALASALSLLDADEGPPSPPLAAILAVSPPTAFGFSGDSLFRYARGVPLLTLKQMLWYWEIYIGGQATTGDTSQPDVFVNATTDFRISPLRAPEELMRALPPVIMIAAQCDVLRDEGYAFHERATALGVPTWYHEFPQTGHGFFGKRLLLSYGVEAVHQAAVSLQQALGRSSHPGSSKPLAL